jgi:hypothetical protein
MGGGQHGHHQDFFVKAGGGIYITYKLILKSLTATFTSLKSTSNVHY